MNRRSFLAALGRAGGATVVTGALAALGLDGARASPAFAPVRTERARGRKVLVLGGGISGMTAAHELVKLGYDVKVLEAAARPGGRCFSVRRGTRVTDTDGETQVCDFDEGLYLNCGPARIPGHHVTLDYCRELGVAVELMVNRNPAAWYHTTKGPLAGRRLRASEVEGDQDGYVAELLAKAVGAGALDAQLTTSDRASLTEYLGGMGWLEKDGRYAGSAHARGYATQPGAGLEAGAAGPALPRADLFVKELGYRFFYKDDPNQQPAMMQVVGGTDRLAHAFARALGPRLVLGAPVRELRQDEHGVRVVYGAEGRTREARAELAVCALPLHLLAKLPADFPEDLRAALAQVKAAAAGKIGLQFSRRFWEEDDRIFGGMSWTDQTITQVMYPSAGLLGRKGVVVGYYAYDEQAAALQALPHARRLETAVLEGERLHPQYRAHLEGAFSVAWGKMPWLEHSWAEWGGPDAPRPPFYERLTRPAGRVHLAGDAVSHQQGWMAGAMLSARSAVTALHARASAEPAPSPATRTEVLP